MQQPPKDASSELGSLLAPPEEDSIVITREGLALYESLK
jgi:hypothetical protein